MKKILGFISLSLPLILIGCAALNTHETNDGVASNTVLIVSAHNMNASTSSTDLNELMGSEVAAFSKALKKDLESEGKDVKFQAFESATQNDIAQAISSMPKKPKFLVQTYWTGKQNNSLYIVADGLGVQYSNSGKTVRFIAQNRKEYLSIGLAAKPSDTPENHAKDYAKQIHNIIASKKLI